MGCIVHKYLVAPGLAVVGAAFTAYTEAAVFSVRRTGARVVAHNNGAIRQLNKVGHTVGYIICIVDNGCRRRPCATLICTEGYHYALALACGHEPTIFKLDDTSITTT